jgi:hypothetical protein
MEGMTTTTTRMCSQTWRASRLTLRPCESWSGSCAQPSRLRELPRLMWETTASGRHRRRSEATRSAGPYSRCAEVAGAGGLSRCRSSCQRQPSPKPRWLAPPTLPSRSRLRRLTIPPSTRVRTDCRLSCGCPCSPDISDCPISQCLAS